MKTFQELKDEMIEAIKKKIVFRAGKKVIKKVTDKKGFKMVGGKEVKMKAKEVIARKKAGKKRAIKMKSKKGVLTKKRLKTMKKRKAGGF